MGLGVLAGLLLSCAVWAQATPSTSMPAAAVALPSVNAAPSATTTGKWKELTAAQQLALEPLAPHWTSLSEAQKKKWLAISKNFDTLPDYEKSTMHSRMAEWATLTPQQRIQARLNYGETNRITPVEKKAQWQAYQSLPEEEKRKFGSAQQAPLLGAAIAPKTSTQDKLSHVQTPVGQQPAKGKTPGVKDLDPKTLLPPSKATPPKADSAPV
jgi:hypothetical protein